MVRIEVVTCFLSGDSAIKAFVMRYFGLFFPDDAPSGQVRGVGINMFMDFLFHKLILGRDL